GHQHRMRALGGRAPYCPYNPDQQTCADESGNQVTQPSAQVDAKEAKNGARNRRPDDSEHDVHHKSHIALHKLFCQPTRNSADDDGCNPADLWIFHGLAPSFDLKQDALNATNIAVASAAREWIVPNLGVAGRNRAEWVG